MRPERRQRSRAWGRWHRRLAAVCVAWLAFLVVTGIPINRAHDWGLDRAELTPGLARLFYAVDNGAGGECATPGVPEDLCRRVSARLAIPSGAVLLTPDEVILVDAAGQIVEQVPASVLGLDRLEAAAVQDQSVYLRGGDTVIRTDSGLVESEVMSLGDQGLPLIETWRVLVSHPDAITWERALLDLHAARFLGPAGPWFADAMAILLACLALTGAWLWWSQRGSRAPGRAHPGSRGRNSVRASRASSRGRRRGPATGPGSAAPREEPRQP